jgi:hypothetical protein
MVLRRIFGHRREEVTGGWRNWRMRNFITTDVPHFTGLIVFMK